MGNVEEIFEVLNLDDISPNDEIDFSILSALDSDLYDEQVEMVQEVNLNFYLFMTPRVYSFKRELGEHVIQWLKHEDVNM